MERGPNRPVDFTGYRRKATSDVFGKKEKQMPLDSTLADVPERPSDVFGKKEKQMRRRMIKIEWRSMLGYGALIMLCLLRPSFAQGQAIIIDHSCTDIRRVPAHYIEKAKATFRVAYGHTSHGSQIVSGMSALRKSNPDLFGFGRGNGTQLSLFDATPPGDLGNPDRSAWARRTRDLLNGDAGDRNLIMWSWCGQVGSASEKDIQLYLDLMSGLEKEFPKVKFVYMTGHLDGSGKNGNLNLRNEQIRKFCAKNGKILFDFADIESFDPDGKVNYMELNANDSCNYMATDVAKNWADEWLKKNPEHGIALPDSAAHSRPLNGALKGRAFWWMMARLAGWDGRPPANTKTTAIPGKTKVNQGESGRGIGIGVSP